MKTMSKDSLIAAAMSRCCVKWIHSGRIEILRYSYLTKRVLAKRLLDKAEHPLTLKREFYFCEIIPLNQIVAIGDLLI